MRKYFFLALVVFLAAYSLGCNKKQAAPEATSAAMSMDTLGTVNTAPASSLTTVNLTEQTQAVQQSAPVMEAKLGPLPPSGPYKPSAQEIQTALRNAGYYTGNVDGKVGPMTKKATEEFQKANNLQADGKVGPKTWSMLSKYLTSAGTITETEKKL